MRLLGEPLAARQQRLVLAQRGSGPRRAQPARATRTGRSVAGAAPHARIPAPRLAASSRLGLGLERLTSGLRRDGCLRQDVPKELAGCRLVDLGDLLRRARRDDLAAGLA